MNDLLLRAADIIEHEARALSHESHEKWSYEDVTCEYEEVATALRARHAEDETITTKPTNEAPPPSHEWNAAICEAELRCLGVAPGHYIAQACAEAVAKLKKG